HSAARAGGRYRPVCAVVGRGPAARKADHGAGRRGLRFGTQPQVRSGPTWRPLGHSGENRPTDRETSDRPLPPSHEAAPQQGLLPLRPTLASRIGLFNDETPPRVLCTGSYLLEPMSGSHAVSHYLQPHAPLEFS